MPVAHLVGMCKKQIPGFEWMNSAPVLAEDNLAFIGLRDIDAAERDIILNSKVHAFSMKDVDCRGIADVVRQALKKIDPEGKRPIHLSFDIDGCDPSIAPGTGTKARGGLSYREVHNLSDVVVNTIHHLYSYCGYDDMMEWCSIAPSYCGIVILIIARIPLLQSNNDHICRLIIFANRFLKLDVLCPWTSSKSTRIEINLMSSFMVMTPRYRKLHRKLFVSDWSLFPLFLEKSFYKLFNLLCIDIWIYRVL